MKTRLLKRLRREARKEFPVLMLAECKGYFVALKFANEAMRNYILRRVVELKGKRKMKTNRLINECHCYNCRKYEECQTKGVFDDDPGFDFCVNYEDVSYPDDDNDEND